MRRAAAVAADLGLWATAVIGVLSLVGAAAMAATGARPVVVRSGSMEPAHPTGSVVVTRPVPVDEVAVGDVLALELPSGTKVLHRVATLERSPAGAVVTTKGDANPEADPHPVQLVTARRAVATVTGLGFVLEAARTPLAGFLAALVLLAPMALGARRGRTAGGLAPQPA